MAVEAPEPAPAPVTPTPPAPARARTRFGRVTIGFNVLLQIALFTAIVLMINAFAFKHFKQFDFSRDKKYALSTRTKQFLAGLNKPAKLLVFMSAGNTIGAQILTDAETTAGQYRVAQPKFITVEIVDPYRDPGRAAEIQGKYKLQQQENVIIATCEDRQKVIKSEDLVDLDQGNEMFGQPPAIKAFKSEQAITNALLEVTEGKKSSAYYIRGHGEPDITGKNGNPYEVLSKILDGEHLNLADLNLLNVESVPADATLLMLLAPKYDLSEREIKLMEDYFNKGGRIMICLNPEVSMPRTGIFLDRLGVRVEDDRVLQTVSIGGGVTGIVRDVYAQVAGSTLIAKELASVNLGFSGSTQSLTLVPANGTASGTKVEPLAVATKGFWGETDYKDMESTGVYFDKGKDKEAPLAVAASIEKGAVGDPRVRVGSSRIIVLGTSKFLESDAMTEADANFFFSSLNWLLSREQLIGIAPRQLRSFTLNLPDPEMRLLFWITTLAVPAFFAFLGVIVWWRRRA